VYQQCTSRFHYWFLFSVIILLRLFLETEQ
jgi:hypothetical protein